MMNKSSANPQLSKLRAAKSAWKKPAVLTLSERELAAHITAAARSGGGCGGFMR